MNVSVSGQSAVAAYLGIGAELSPVELATLESLEGDPRGVGRGTKVRDQDELFETLYIVRDGWLRLDNELFDGRRHIVRTFQRGDIVGLHELAERRTQAALVACTDVTLCPFPKRTLAGLATEFPRLFALLLALSARDQMLLADLLRITGRLSARARVSYLLLTYLHRARASDASLDDTFLLGLDQSQIGDMIGLTNVSVSKAFVALEGEGLITRRRQLITLTDIARLSRGVGFVDRFTVPDVSWFPPVSEEAVR